MDFELWPRVLSTALFDWCLALVCGCLLTEGWLPSVRGLSYRTPALLMAGSLCAQMYLMTIALAGRARVSDVLAVAGTHAGTVLVYSLLVACLLPLAGLRFVRVILVCVLLALHAAIGHAAAQGDFTGAELLQLLHLSAMAVWTGGVVAAALFVAPVLARMPPQARESCLGRLSSSSTWAALLALLTGAIKGYSGLDGHVAGVMHTAWGRILLLKLCLVCVALLLGFANRRGIRDKWKGSALGLTLRVEAVCLTLVVLISAWLSSAEPA